MPYKNIEERRAFARRYKAEHKDYLKAQAWRNYLKRHYGLTSEEHELMKLKQNNRCAICKGVGRLDTDHDHTTNKVRGLLCIKCNTQLGAYESYKERIPLMENYLKEFK